MKIKKKVHNEIFVFDFNKKCSKLWKFTLSYKTDISVFSVKNKKVKYYVVIDLYAYYIPAD